MFDYRRIALGLHDADPFASPSRPVTPELRRHEGDGAVRTLIRAIRRELAHATEEPVIDWLPRVSRYPY